MNVNSSRYKSPLNKKVGQDGKTKQVLIVASPGTNTLMMIGRDSKGHKGIIGTPIETYVGTLVHNHDRTFYNYAIRHQECMQHNIRYLARQEYVYEPPSEYYKEGYNLYLRLSRYKESELLFLHDKSVPTNNSLASKGL